MNWNTSFTITLPGAMAAADIRERFEPTPAGRAYIACCKAEEEVHDACGDIQEGAPPSVLDKPGRRQGEALEAFHAATGERFYSLNRFEEEEPSCYAGTYSED